MNAILLGELQRIAPDRYLALWLAPAPARTFLLGLLSLERELRSLTGKTDNPTIGLMRVVWWRDALLEPTGKVQPILQVLATYPNSAAKLSAYAETFEILFDETLDRPSILQSRAELLASLLAEPLGAPVPLLYQAALALDDVQAKAGLPQVLNAYDRQARRLAAALLLSALLPLGAGPLRRAWLALRLSI